MVIARPSKEKLRDDLDIPILFPTCYDAVVGNKGWEKVPKANFKDYLKWEIQLFEILNGRVVIIEILP